MHTLVEEMRGSGRRFYAIGFAIRSGSTLLCEDLRASSWGSPTEYFQPRDGAPRGEFLGVTANSLREYLLKIVTQNPTPFFGFKISWDQLNVLGRNLERECGLAMQFDLSRLFPDLRYLYIYRENKVLQAISAWRAVKTAIWHMTTGQTESKAPRAALAYDFEEIKPYYFQVLSEDWIWRQHFHKLGVKPLEICYESFVRDRAGTLQAIGRFLDAPADTLTCPSHTLNLMRDELSLEMERRFLADLYKPRSPFWVHAEPPQAMPEL